MSSGTPSSLLRSPSQTNHFYSPPNKTRPFFKTEYPGQPQTPPPFTQTTLAHSPHYGPHPIVPPSLPAINGHGAHPQEATQNYQTNTGSPPYQLQRTYSGQLIPAHNLPALAGSPSSHAHPIGRRDSLVHSPVQEHEKELNTSTNGFTGQGNTTPTIGPRSQEKPVRANDPMSFASILSEPATSIRTPPMAPSVPKNPRKPPTSQKASPAKIENAKDPTQKREASVATYGISSGLMHANGYPPALPKPRRILTPRENERVSKALASIDETVFSDVETTGFDVEREQYNEKSKKRALEVSELEARKRKRRRTYLLDTMSRGFTVRVSGASDRFRSQYEAAAQGEVHEKEIQDEKERKKDMQRKRRREQAIKLETQKMEEAEEKAQNAPDEETRDKYLREVEKSQKKIKQTQATIDRGNGPDEIHELQPLAPNLEGGTTSSFHITTPASPEPAKKKTKQQAGPITRPKKSKERKQAEKDAAEAAYAAMEKEEPVRIAPKELPRKEAIKRESKVSRSKESTPIVHITNYDSKGYAQIYDQIWRDIAKRDIGKVHRLKAASLSTKQENLRKTAQLASKQARKWQERTNKSMKDTQARAKRTMREMMSFWKRNEREERDLRRMAERKEIEDARKAEADREANRQKRKLNFLISQTELYSHFIGRKIKTDEVERATDDPEVAASNQKIQPGKDGAHVISLPDSNADLSTRIRNFEDLDFDAEDDTALKEAAMANAQNAIQEAQDKARAFNGDQMAAFDDSELNFQNPTSIGDVQVAQPKMLQAQLKEYQLKGLNWLVNLYEQGINGILADEMGLGKTVQSISVMGYLAEQHNIWGPFLVIAPSSTLHNWQQEIAKFVPSIKVLPYWGSAKDRKVLRKFWDRKHITYTRESEFHVLVTSYQLVVQDSQYFQKVKWQYMILDEAQAIKSSNSSRWKVLLGFHCRNRLLLTGTPIQNNMQELWALLHFIMPTLFDSHDEFSDWFSKDIESHAQSNTKLNQDQLKRLHMILKPFMLRRVKAHVQKELGDKVEKDVFCDLTYRQRAYYSNLRSRISIMDLIEKATVGDDQDTATLMNLVMQFRKVCNHPDLFERADTASPLSLSYFAETASFLREGPNIQVGYSVRNLIQYELPRMLCSPNGRLDVAGPHNDKASFDSQYLRHMMNIWTPDFIKESCESNDCFSFLRFAGTSYGEAQACARKGLFERAVELKSHSQPAASATWIYEDDQKTSVGGDHALFNIVEKSPRNSPAEIGGSKLRSLLNISHTTFEEGGFAQLEPAARPKASAPPIQISCSNQSSITEQQQSLFNVPVRNALFPLSGQFEEAALGQNIDPAMFPASDMLPAPTSQKARYTNISVPSMRRFVTDSGKLAKLDQLLRDLKMGGHRVLLYFQMTRMIDLMEEYLTYRNYKYCRLDGSTKLEDRRDTVHDFQTRPEIFIFLLSTRAGGLGINLTSADTVIFYDSDWNPTIDSQAMDRAHRLGQTKQVTVYRMITRGTIEERIRKRALQKEEVQKVVISGGASGGVDFNTRNRDNRTKDIAMWLADDDQAALIEQKEKEAAEKPAEDEAKSKKGKKGGTGILKRKRGEMSLDDMYHEGEGHFEDASAKPSGAATPVSAAEPPTSGPSKRPRGGKGISKKAKTVKERLRVIDAEGDMGMGGT